ncbi:ester cyclase [Planobispora siamensis]|uniref:SnoaL-like polyketide cyclase n=1 Tax=Planobispora siamensis TaxID=936338 RepID=A0A8J3SK01_9ACTN|nr:ester cyclase [Planobispora siamensis]GIH94317.1 hypothetical protein Psi01_49470 [Planobispora siamensis]
MSSLTDRLLELWQAPPADPAAAEAAFRALYADPLTVNGTAFTVAGLVQRARELHRTYADLAMEPVEVVETPGRVVLAFRMRARHVGPLTTPFGTVPATGRTVRLRVIDVLTVEDGLVTAVWMVADELDLLRQLTAGTPAGAHPIDLDKTVEIRPRAAGSRLR